MARTPITVQELWSLPRVGDPEPAPDGSQYVVPVTTYSMQTNKGTTRLWLVPADAVEAGDGGEKDRARALTATEVSSASPRFSPDGRRIAFVRTPGGEKGNGGSKAGPRHPDKPQLYILSLDGGEPDRVTDLPLGLCDPQWHPDGRRILFLGAVYRDAPGIEATAALAKTREEDPVKAMRTEDRVFRYWDHWLTDGAIHHVFLLDLETRALRDLTPEEKRWFDLDDPTGQYRVSPDGKEIAFSACRVDPPYDPLATGVFTVPVPGRKGDEKKMPPVREITLPGVADCFRPVYSPDGRWIVFGMQREFDFYADKVRLVAHDRATGKQTVLTEEWDGSASAWTFQRGGAAGSNLLVMAEDRGRTVLYALDVEAAVAKKSRRTPQEVCRGGWFGNPATAAGRIFVNASSLRTPPEVYVCDGRGRGLHRSSGFTKPGLADKEICSVEETVVPGAGGRSVHVFLVLPPGVSGTDKAPKKPWPLVHMIHGGPHGAFGDQWHWRWNPHVFAAPGYLVAQVNFHGSTGYGTEFCASILGRWGDQPYQDVMAVTDHLIDRGLADPKRMAATGGSYGGYLVAWIASQTDRFAALVNHAGVSDFQPQYASDITQGRARSMGGEPWENVQGMDRYNPLRHAKGFRSPMLVIHGEKDYRVPYCQGIEIYSVYKAMKLPARLVVFPDENHWILKPRNSVLWYEEVLGWLDRYVGSGAGKRTKDGAPGEARAARGKGKKR